MRTCLCNEKIAKRSWQCTILIYNRVIRAKTSKQANLPNIFFSYPFYTQKGENSETLFVILDFIPFWVTLTYLQWLNVHFVPTLIDFFSFNNYVTPSNLYIHPTHFALSGKIDEILLCMGNFANISFDRLNGKFTEQLSEQPSKLACSLAHLLTCLLGNFYRASERAS